MFNPLFSLVFQLLKGFGLQSLEDFCICSLHLPVASWVGHRGKTYLEAHFFAEVEEGFASYPCVLPTNLPRYPSVFFVFIPVSPQIREDRA